MANALHWLSPQPAALRFFLIALSLCMVLTRMNALPCSKRLGRFLPGLGSVPAFQAFPSLSAPVQPSRPLLSTRAQSSLCFVAQPSLFPLRATTLSANTCPPFREQSRSWMPRVFPGLMRSMRESRTGRTNPVAMSESAGSDGAAQAEAAKPQGTKRGGGKKRQRDPKKQKLDEERARIAADLRKEFEMDGVMAINKPANWTSFDVVAKVRSELGKLLRNANPELTYKQCRVKVGHGGTLDPMATGVLVLGVGSGTKLMDEYTKGSKCYEAVGIFGFETDTGDAEGTQTGEVKDFADVTDDSLRVALSKFQGEISQIPPVYSAIKKDGKKAYELARKGIEVEMEARQVHIYKLELTKPYEETKPRFHLSIECGGGTYIRSLVRDIAQELGTAAHMQHLVRTKQGEFLLPDCLPAEQLTEGPAILAALHDANLLLAERKASAAPEASEQ